MAQDKDLPIVFLGGMDRDTELRSVADGDFMDALNTRNAVTDQDNRSAVENVRGNVLVINNSLANGVNKVIGSIEDNKDDSIIYFVYNSLGYHGIYRYWRNKPIGTNGSIETLLQIRYPQAYTINSNPLNFDPDHFITGVDLIQDKLYWTDDLNRSRKINIVKANLNNKGLKYNVYFNNNSLVSTGTAYTLTVYQFGTIVTTLAWSSTATTVYDAVKDMMNAYHGSTNAVNVMNFTSHNEYINIEMTASGSYYIQLDDNTNGFIQLVVPENFYPEKDLQTESIFPVTTYDYFSHDLIDRVKYQPLREPFVMYKTDVTRNVNLVRQKVFQFRCQYVYDDDDVSAWGAISIIPLAVSSCDDGVISLADNYIEVDFTDPRLNNPSLMSIIKRVNIAVREHNEGDWQIVDSLHPWQWGIGTNTYKFYNDKIFTQLADQNDFIRPFDSVFLQHKSQKLVDGRLFDACGTEGYDKVDVDAKVITSYTPPPSSQRYSIKGIISIRNIYADDGTAFVYNQPIRNEGGGDGIVYGGFKNISFTQGGYVETGQVLPLGGWPVYLAGTDYYAVSQQQIIIPYLAGVSGSQWYDGATTPSIFADITVADHTAIINYITGSNPYGIGRPCGDPFGLGMGARDQNNKLIGDVNPGYNSMVYSTFEIKNVPEGEYVLRIADGRTSLAVLNDGTRNYQRTSANFLTVGGFDFTNGDGFEAKIKVNSTTADANNVVYVGNSTVLDASGGLVVQGYVTDSDNATVTTSYSSFLNEESTRIERARILMSPDSNVGTVGWNALVTNTSQSWGGKLLHEWNIFGRTYTDHNGYFFYATLATTELSPQINAFYSGATVFTTQGLDSGNNPWTPITTSPDKKDGVFRTSSIDVKTKCRTYLKGQVIASNGAGLPNLNVVNTHGAVGKTDFNGEYLIPTYIDTWKHFAGQSHYRTDYVVFDSGTSSCVTTFTDTEILYGIVIDGTTNATPPPYNNISPDYWYLLGISNAAITGSSIARCAFKNGSDVQFGIVYYDEADRRTAVCTNDTLKQHFLFPTELNGNLGIPSVSWAVYHEPPMWAKKWRWVRTKNTQLNYYLQWAIDFVTYVADDNTTVVGQGLATKIKISTANFAKYKEKHPNSPLDYSFSKGDRIRFITQDNGTKFTSYYDYEVLDVGTGGAYLLIYNDVSLPTLKAGDLYEIYTPRTVQNYTVFYEFGETFEVGINYASGIKRAFHKGLTQDQSYLPIPVGFNTVIPATGTFKTGDAYYRARNIPVSSNTTLAYRNKIVADASVSDFYDSEDESIGRTNTNADEVGQIRRPTTIRFSNRYVEDTRINGLSTFHALNQKQFSTNFGNINNLILLGDDVLMAICDNSKIVTMYINKNVLRQASGATNLVSLSDDVIPQNTPLMQTYGTQNPESVAINDERDVFMWDKQIATVPRYTGNLLTPISDFKMNNYFIQLSELQLAYPREAIQTVSVYDRFFDEYIITFRPIETQIPKRAHARICIPDFDTDMEFTVSHEPSGQVIGFAQIPTFAPLSTGDTLLQTINSQGTGFFAIFDIVSNCIDVYAPFAGSNYNNTTLVVQMKYNGAVIHSIQFKMEGGTD